MSLSRYNLEATVHNVLSEAMPITLSGQAIYRCALFVFLFTFPSPTPVENARKLGVQAFSKAILLSLFDKYRLSSKWI